MRRSSLLLVTVAMALLALSAGVMAADERDPRSALRQVVHPLVGTWIVDTNVADEQDPPALLTIGGDGTIRLTDCCNAPAAGAWAPSSTRTADATLLLPWFDEDGFMGFNVVRADVVVSADGATLTGTYTMDIPSRDGSTSGQLGPVSASGRRVAVEPMGTPVAPLPIQSPEMDPSASPEPSPAP